MSDEHDKCPKCGADLGEFGSFMANWTTCNRCGNQWSEVSGKSISAFSFNNCPDCGSSDLQVGCSGARLCNDCGCMWTPGDEENRTKGSENYDKNAKSKGGKGGGCCGKGAKQECDKQKEEQKKKEEEGKTKGGGCCGKGAKAQCQQQQQEAPPSVPSIKGICAQLPALVNPLVPSGVEIANFVQAVVEDYNAISSVSYPPSCAQLDSVAGLVTKYSSFIPMFA